MLAKVLVGFEAQTECSGFTQHAQILSNKDCLKKL
jgi:hypothetical protein